MHEQANERTNERFAFFFHLCGAHTRCAWQRGTCVLPVGVIDTPHRLRLLLLFFFEYLPYVGRRDKNRNRLIDPNAPSLRE